MPITKKIKLIINRVKWRVAKFAHASYWRGWTAGIEHVCCMLEDPNVSNFHELNRIMRAAETRLLTTKGKQK